MQTVEQSGAIPHLVRDDQLHIVLISSRSSGNWIIPKGLVEPDMTPAESAANEAWEEAGVRGQIGSTIHGSFEYQKWSRLCQVDVYDLAVTKIFSHWDEMDSRERTIVPIAEALDMIQDNMKPALEAFAEFQSD